MSYVADGGLCRAFSVAGEATIRRSVFKVHIFQESGEQNPMELQRGSCWDEIGVLLFE